MGSARVVICKSDISEMPSEGLLRAGRYEWGPLLETAGRMPSQKNKNKNRRNWRINIPRLFPRERAGRSDEGLIASYALRAVAEADANADHISGSQESLRGVGWMRLTDTKTLLSLMDLC